MPIYVPPGGEAVVHRCLDSLEADADGLCKFGERVVVANGFNPIEFRCRLADRLVSFFTQSHASVKPLGFTKAFNIGLYLVQGDVVQLNSDTVVPKGWLDTLVRDADMAGGVMCCDDNHLNIGPGIHKDRAWGACFYLPRRVIDKVGLWDETLNWRYSDQDYWIRCHQAGFKVGVTGNVKIEHVNSHAFKHQMRDPAISEAVNEERREMISRYGEASFERWVKKSGTKPVDSHAATC
jgi:hypothetical protein